MRGGGGIAAGQISLRILAIYFRPLLHVVDCLWNVWLHMPFFLLGNRSFRDKPLMCAVVAGGKSEEKR